MKPCCVCAILGIAIGMVAAGLILTSNKKAFDFVKKGKQAVGKKIEEMGNSDNSESKNMM